VPREGVRGSSPSRRYTARRKLSAMNSAYFSIALVVLIAMAITPVFLPPPSEKINYPESKRIDHVDTYFGVSVPDPYRWLEDENGADTKAWVEAQNKVTFGYLGRIPYRRKLKERLEKLVNYPRYGAPFRNGEYFFFSKNDGLQNQSVLYMQKGLEGTPEVLIDPNKFSADGTSQLAELALSKDGKYIAYGISAGGSDWRDVHVMEVASRKVLDDVLHWVKVSGLAWQGNGFYYSRYGEPKAGKELTSENDDHKVYFHRVGTSQADDELVYSDPANPQRFHTVETTEDERFAILYIEDLGKGKKGNAIFARDAQKSDKRWNPVIADITDDQFSVVDNIEDKFLIRTNKDAPNWKLVLVDVKNPQEKSWNVVLPEKLEPLEGASTGGGKIFAKYLKDVTTRAYVYDLAGKLENEITLPGPGTASGFGGKRDDKFIFYTFNSLNVPPSIYKYDIGSHTSNLFRTPQIPGFRSDDYETKEVFYTSKDGTRIPMFIVHKKGLTLDGNNPTILYGYGGFNITVEPTFSALRIALLEQGVIYASANLRGGAEYGEKWHEAGMKLRKQNVFDDFIAAAEYLISNKYTSSQRLAIQGASNGGLLVGAVANQRPDLMKVVLQHAGVMDMLRFHKFTIGFNWIADYGSSDNEAEFKVLRGYSPIHNTHDGGAYPAVLTTTADHDDRVVPAHSFKYAAALQHAQTGPNPVLIRIDTKSGHGASSTTKSIEQTADIDAFLFRNLGVTPEY
jgi:prolyl oligopeptidase